MSTFEERQRNRQLDRTALEALQLEKLNCLLRTLRSENRFYNPKLMQAPEKFESLEQLRSLPFTTKDELQPIGGEPFAANRTYPIEQYVRLHQTSGTRGRPLVVLDTAEDWRWWLECWQYVLDAAGIATHDRALLAFSFGPFIGFWSAFDALTARGALVVPGGGLGSLPRIEMIRHTGITALFCTPTYALRLAEVAAEHNISLIDTSVEKIIVAGEPGGSVPATRERIEAAWGARVIDHGGATEVGAWGFADSDGRGMHVNEAEFIPEFLSVETDQPAEECELAQLVLTSLGRAGSPVIRYRTGDLVRPLWNADDETRFVLLERGILARADEMVIIRGMNVYPTSIEQIMHTFPEVVEYRVTARRHGSMDALIVEVEDHLQQPDRIANELRMKLGLNVDVRCVTSMSLPRYEGKGRRFIDERNSPPSIK